MDLADYNLYRLLDPIIKCQAYLYMEELLLSWRLAQTMEEATLELFHTQSWPHQSDTECCLCIIFVFVFVFLFGIVYDNRGSWPQFIPPTEMTSSVRNRQMANPRPRPDVSQEMWKKEIKTFDNLSFLAKLKLQLKSRPEKFRKLWERANYEIRPLSLFIPKALQT